VSIRRNAAASALEHPSSGVSPLPPTGTLQQAYLHAGHMVISREPCRVTTVLGSCVAVGLWDPTSGIGGINHFLLPQGSDPASARFGNAAVRTLIREVVAAAACRPSCLAVRVCSVHSAASAMATISDRRTSRSPGRF
jgi:Chemotaxis protein; stimulates methylation of MCP proteins